MKAPVLVVVSVAALLAGISGSALATHVFRDVRHTGPHAAGIGWAHENAIIEGHPDGTFRPRDTILRDQAATMLHRYEQHVDRKLAAFDEEVDRKIQAAMPNALEPMPPFGQAGLLLDPGGVHVPKPVYVADNPELRRQGLMGVDHLPRQGGMVFLYAAEARGGFWMKDTLIPLSIAFFDADGLVLATLDMEPCEADPCPTYDPGVAYHGALEVNRGRFADLGLPASGWRVDIPPHLVAES